MSVTINLILIVVLILVNAFFAGSEAALVAANEVKVKSDVKKNVKGAKLKEKLMPILSFHILIQKNGISQKLVTF